MRRRAVQLAPVSEALGITDLFQRTVAEPEDGLDLGHGSCTSEPLFAKMQ